MIEEWRNVVKRAKKNSTLSVFSKRNYSLYKCSLESELLTSLLVKYYNIIIIKGFYSNQWLKILDVMLKKGKGLVLRKLYTIQLIKADF